MASMRVLLMAEHCNPEWPSLPMVGYQMARALSRRVELCLATHVRNRKAVEGRLSRAEVTFVDNEYVAGPLHRLAEVIRGQAQNNWSTATASSYPSVLAFDYEVKRLFGRRLAEGEFDVVHRLTPMSPTLPSPMASWSPAPFVLGPLNGGLSWPDHFHEERRREREALHHLRRAYKLLPYHRSTFRCASAILTSFAHTLADMPEEALERCINFPEVGVDPALFESSGPRPEKSQLTIISVGRFVPMKLFDVALSVMAESELLRRHKLVLVGDGMERAQLEAQVRAQGLQGCVEFTGWLPQAEVARRLREADIFLFPSIRELGGGVVVEAMACGCVPVVVDYGGPGGLVAGHECGAAVPLGDRAQLVQRFAMALEDYAASRPLRLAHAAAAYRRAMETLSWDAKAAKLVEIYEWVLGRRSRRPRFGVAVPPLPPQPEYTPLVSNGGGMSTK